MKNFFELKELFEREIDLSGYTTIGLGGPARYFYAVKDLDELVEVIEFARSEKLKFFFLGGGSNVIFSDDGYDGIVFKNELKGIEIHETLNDTLFEVNSGEEWDSFVKETVNHGYSGIECLSGIPGTVGATPVQNVGAYGQEVKETISSVTCIDLDSLAKVTFGNNECNFTYRNSRFKGIDRGKYFISKVEFRLSDKTQPAIKYESLSSKLRTEFPEFESMEMKSKLDLIRESVIEIRRTKSMVIDSRDPESRSCGSFFMNPVLSPEKFEKLNSEKDRCLQNAPAYKSGSEIKVSAAWLIENSGFEKGYSMNGAAISSNHSLALVNKGTTARDLLLLANEIIGAVYEKFGIKLEIEPVIM